MRRIAAAVLMLTAGLGLYAQSSGAPDSRATKAAFPLLSFPAEISCDPIGEPGAVIRLHASSAEGIDSMTAYLSDSAGGIVSRATSFRVDGPTAASGWIGLIGVPSTARRGSYRVFASVSRLGRESLLLAPVSIIPRSFSTEKITLSQALSELRTVPDARKTEEARRLAALLATAHAEDFFERDVFLFPVEGARRTAGFGDRREYRYAGGGSDLSVHNGLDLALPEGSPVKACGEGRVVLAEDRALTGMSVVVEHLPGVYSLYYHMSEISVREGDQVGKGQQLGKVGHTGLATGPHLHWELQVLSVPVDPDLFVRVPLLDKPAVSVPNAGE